METLSSIISDTVFRNEENNYSVVQVRSQGDEVTVVGCLPALSPGEAVLFEGDWDEHPIYGKQFKANRFTIETPSSLQGIERYLSSGLIKGVGPTTARLIVQEFGKDTLDIMMYQPEKLMDIPGIGRVRYQQITTSFSEQVSTRRAMIFLQTYGISPQLSIKITKHYGDTTEKVVRSNPYQMIDDIDGVGFLTADKIAQTIGLSFDSEFRLQYGIKYVLIDASASEGHTYLPRDVAIQRASSLLGVSPQTTEPHLQTLLLSKKLTTTIIGDVEAIFVTGILSIEKEIALRLVRHACTTPDHIQVEKIRKSIKAYEKKENIQFSKNQREAIEQAATNSLLIITGGPGTGKTTIINCILYVLGHSDQTLLAAPTGRAAKRMEETTGHEAKTIHRLLEYSGEAEQFVHDADNLLDCRCLIVDEVSMVDIYLMRSLLRAINPETQLILVGDADQLPSVGPGNVLGDMLRSQSLPQVRLNEIFRQDKMSAIVTNAHRINHGEMPILNQKNSDFYFERKSSADQAANTIVQLCASRLPEYLKVSDGLQNIQVLSPTKKGLCGVENLNRLLQAALNPKSGDKGEIMYGETIFRVGDKVIHTRNNYRLEWLAQNGEEGTGVFNGDIGFVTQAHDDEKTLTVLYDDSRSVAYEYKQLEDLDLAYCLSVHKSQGGEFSAVVMPVIGGPPMLMTRNLFYTAMTRARKLVVLVGMQHAIETLVQNDHITRRYTSLFEHITQYAGAYENA